MIAANVKKVLKENLISNDIKWLIHKTQNLLNVKIFIADKHFPANSTQKDISRQYIVDK